MIYKIKLKTSAVINEFMGKARPRPAVAIRHL
jgi:hypothetical protein